MHLKWEVIIKLLNYQIRFGNTKGEIWVKKAIFGVIFFCPPHPKKKEEKKVVLFWGGVPLITTCCMCSLLVLRCKMLVWTESIGSLIASRLILSRQLQLSDLHWTFTEQGFVWNLKFRIWNLKFGKWLRWKGRACEQHPVYLLCLKVYRCWNIKTGFAFLSWKSIKAILPPIRSQIQCEVVGDAFIFWQIVSFHRRHKYLKCEANAHKSLSHIIHIPPQSVS